jgi:hypothetical protein
VPALSVSLRQLCFSFPGLIWPFFPKFISFGHPGRGTNGEAFCGVTNLGIIWEKHGQGKQIMRGNVFLNALANSKVDILQIVLDILKKTGSK